MSIVSFKQTCRLNWGEPHPTASSLSPQNLECASRTAQNPRKLDPLPTYRWFDLSAVFSLTLIECSMMSIGLSGIRGFLSLYRPYQSFCWLSSLIVCRSQSKLLNTNCSVPNGGPVHSGYPKWMTVETPSKPLVYSSGCGHFFFYFKSSRHGWSKRVLKMLACYPDRRKWLGTLISECCTRHIEAMECIREANWQITQAYTERWSGNCI